MPERVVQHYSGASRAPVAATEERGITFISGDLSEMPNMQPALDHRLRDRKPSCILPSAEHVAAPILVWTKMASEMSEAMESNKDQGPHHSYKDD
ncbi:MAG TPA: hypothetical protein VLG46_16505, partial [Anaerolineae bacterium]|nr:hypothetical protein [Anaerolineae bacterium]